LFEKDDQRPQFLQSWLKRQDGIGRIVKEEYFLDYITVQKRERISYE
jgi:hypothetical protein